VKGLKRRVTVEGLNLERFFRVAGEQGVVCRGTRRSGRKCTVLVDENKITLLENIAQQGGWKITVGSRQGIGRHLNKVHRHWLLAGLSAVFVIGLYIMSRLMWSITLIDAGPYGSDAQMYLRELGIQAPKWKSAVNFPELRDLLEWRYPDVAWVDCGWRGTELRITFTQGIPVDEHAAKDISRDIIASRGGIVESVVTLAGTPVVAPGDVITAGQLLIQGYERGSDDTQTPVSARGIVKVRVWDSASAKVSLRETQTSYTGNVAEVIWMDSGLFKLWRPGEATYEHFDTRRRTSPFGGLFFPLVLHIDEYQECHIDNMARPIEQVKQEAGEAAVLLLREKTGFDDDFVDKWVDYCMIEDEEVCAIAYGERIVDVASYE